MKAVKWVLFMCVALFVLWAALGCVLVAPARCSPTKSDAAKPAGDTRLVQPALPGLRFTAATPLY